MARCLPAFLAGLIVLGLAGCSASGSRLQTAPDFSLPEVVSGKKTVLSETNREKPVLLVFWASWCPACREEIPQVNEIYKKYSPEDLQILAVNVQESAGILKPFLKEFSIEYPVVMDESGEVSVKYGIEGLPTSVLLAKGGKILYYGFSLPGNLSELLETRRVS